MAIAFVASSTQHIGTSGTLTVAVPTGVVDGDVMIACGGEAGASSFTPPAGWTQLDSDVTGPTAATWWKLAASEPASYNWTVTNATDIYVVAYSGCDQTTPVNVHALQKNASSTTVTAPSITTTANNCVLIWAGSVGAARTFTQPTSYTVRATRNPTTEQLLIADIGQATAGATGTVAGSISSAAANDGTLIALAPATAAAPSNTVAPAVTGTTTVGQTLSTTNGTWTDNGGSVFTYQWQDSADGSTGWANIASATNQTYTIGSGELSKFIRCVVTDTDSTAQATAANSNVVGAIAAAPSLSTVAGKTGTSGTAVMQKAKSGWTYITGKKNTSGTAVDQKGLGGFTKIKGH